MILCIIMNKHSYFIYWSFIKEDMTIRRIKRPKISNFVNCISLWHLNCKGQSHREQKASKAILCTRITIETTISFQFVFWSTCASFSSLRNVFYHFLFSIIKWNFSEEWKQFLFTCSIYDGLFRYVSRIIKVSLMSVDWRHTLPTPTPPALARKACMTWATVISRVITTINLTN